MKMRSGLFAGAAAVLFTQTALAAPAALPAPSDPLVALSALGTSQSRAAVAPAVGAGAAQVVAPVAGPPPPPPPGWPANQFPRPNQYDRSAWVFLPAMLALIAILALYLSDDDGPDFTPVSP